MPPEAAAEAVAAGAVSAAAGRRCFAELVVALSLCLAAALGDHVRGVRGGVVFGRSGTRLVFQ